MRITYVCAERPYSSDQSQPRASLWMVSRETCPHEIESMNALPRISRSITLLAAGWQSMRRKFSPSISALLYRFMSKIRKQGAYFTLNLHAVRSCWGYKTSANTGTIQVYADREIFLSRLITSCNDIFWYRRRMERRTCNTDTGKTLSWFDSTKFFILLLC